jgi:hypothetical protein
VSRGLQARSDGGSLAESLVNPSVTHSRVVHEVFVPVLRVPSHPVLRHWLRGRGGWLSRLRQWWLERKVSRIAHAVLESLRSLKLMEAGTSTVIVSTGRESILVRLWV